MAKYCQATITFGDDYGDNVTTCHCQLLKRHKGPHMESGDMGYGKAGKRYVLQWGNTMKMKHLEWAFEDVDDAEP